MSKVFVEAVLLPHVALPSADWADRYGVTTQGPALAAIDLARLMFGRSPRWVRMLLKMRNQVVSLFGLKSADLAVGDSQSIGAFPVVSTRDDQVVMGFDDHHLDFRIVVDVTVPASQMQTVSVTTLVHRHNRFGRLYIFVITPFHKLIVKTMLARVR